ncbi:MAG: four helix bundle protein [Tepidisphaeraceae bacterium]
MARSFRELVVWQRASELAVEVYRSTRSWPREELYGLTSQVRRAVISVTSNIAEGEGRKSPKEFCHFLRTAMGSLREVESQLFVAKELGFLDDAALHAFDELCSEVGRMLNGLLSKVSARV